MPAAVTKSRPSDANVTYIGDLPGRYTLSSREGADDGRVKVFACRARSISPQRAFLFAPVSGKVGERLAMHFADLGVLKAQISRNLDDGFVAEIEPAGLDIAALSARIAWLKQKRFRALADMRAHKRWIPRLSKSTLSLPGDVQIDCFVIDVSASGAAISADAVVEVGTKLAVGALAGRVVRKLELGYAVQFSEPQDPAKVEPLLAVSQPGGNAVVGEAIADAPAGQAG